MSPPDRTRRPSEGGDRAPVAEVLGRVRRIEITARRLVDDVFAGQYSSTFKGRGMEFSEVREYLPGDDVRSIDWNVTARLGHPYLKRYVEERELTILFLVDASGSLRFGSRRHFKSELAAELAAVLSLSALRNNDKVGLILFTDRVERYVPARKTRGHVLRLIRELVGFSPASRKTSLAAGLEYLTRVQRRRAVVFLLSDFLDSGFERALRVAARRHDLIALALEDPWEEALPRGVRLRLRDGESGLVREGRGGALAGNAGLKALFRRAGVDAVFVRAGRPYVEAFLKFFDERARRLH